MRLPVFDRRRAGVLLPMSALEAALGRGGRAFIDWLTSPDGQRTIAGYKINGEQLFFPDYGKPAS